MGETRTRNLRRFQGQSRVISLGRRMACVAEDIPARDQEYCRETEQHSDDTKPVELHTTSGSARGIAACTVSGVFLKVELDRSHFQLHVTDPVLQNLCIHSKKG